MKVIETIPEEIFRKFCDYYNKRDLDKILSLFGQDACLWGTGIDEYRIGIEEIKAQFERDWSQSTSGKLEISKHIHTSKDGRLWGCVECLVKVEIEGEVKEFPHLRGSVFFEEEENIMKIAFMHCSFPDQSQEVGESFRK